MRYLWNGPSEGVQAGDVPVWDATLGAFVPSGLVSGAALDFYVDPVAGSDANPGTQAAPLQTLARAYALMPLMALPTNYVRIHMRSGTYAVPVIPPMVLGASLVHFADEAWDPNVYTQTNTGVAGAGTTNVLVDVTALGPGVNALRNQFIRFLDGAAAGQIRLIRNNDATDAIPAIAFNPAPAPGDSYETFTVGNVTMDFDTLPGTDSRRPWIVHGGMLGRDGSGGNQVGAAIMFVGMRMIGTGLQPNIIGSDVALYGVSSAGVAMGVHGATRLWAGHDSTTTATAASATAIADALGLPNPNFYYGWGAVFEDGAGAPLVDNEGELQLISNFNAGRVWSSGFVRIRAGSSLFATTGLQMFRGRFNVEPISGSPVPTIEQTGAGTAFGLVQSEGFIAGGQIDSQAGVAVSVAQNSRLALDDSATGESAAGLSVQCRYASSVVLVGGAPNFGRAAGNDYDIGDGAPQNKAFFAADGTTMFNAASPHAGSAIIRQG